ncbi:RNA polymerase sigma factor CarQ [Posidoniimonas corsicana]|uniref:RNA polymerase sigma factor CarQ n=1 Tax=Posidoniimonas corsicana TaxID=1938618 RepID=A0A5C5VF27_9BACT|nr:sigma-70 family RNA polymerase sigma factor [Posidoniimonas corsicana]TWT36643.1 RNA polymerase sigma factor CarQ [Posidoniimonas corsicana]
MAVSDEANERFVELLAAHTKRLYAFIRTLMLNGENDAEEVFQATCLVLWRKFGEYDPAKDFGAWACRMAYFEALRQKHKSQRIQHMSEAALEALAVAAEPIAQQIDRRREALADCLAKLNVPDRETVQLRYFTGLRPKEMAARKGRPRHTVYRELSRIHSLLMRCVQRKLESE